MSTFHYIARDQNGQQIEGQRKGESRQEILSWLRGEGHTPITITQAKSKTAKSVRVRPGTRIKSIE